MNILNRWRCVEMFKRFKRFETKMNDAYRNADGFEKRIEPGFSTKVH